MADDREITKSEPDQKPSFFLFKEPAPYSQEEADQRSSIRLYCLQNMSEMLNNLFPYVQKSTKNNIRFKHLDWTIFLKPVHLVEASTNLPVGGWFNSSTHEFGFDLISLYAAMKTYQNNKASISYNSDSLYKGITEHLADLAGISLGQINARKKGKNSLWGQRENPLVIPGFQWSSFQDKQNPEIEVYHSKTNQIIGYVEYYITNNLSKRLKIYHTLWAQHKGQNIHWQAIFPQKPYMLYNLYKINKSSDDVPVVFVNDEFLAKFYQYNVTDVIYTTCPGGLINLPDADLSALHGRKVFVELDSPSRELQILPIFLKKAKDKGINVAMVFNGRYNKNDEDNDRKYFTEIFKSSERVTHKVKIKVNRAITAEEFLKEPNKYGYVDVGRLYESQSTGHASVIIKPGEKIPGTDKKREILLHPEIIEEGYIVWLYGLRDVGKTLMALSIAHAVAKGGQQLGAWCSKQPKKVLYVFGEGKPDKIEKSIKKIMAGRGDDGEIPFSIILDKKGASRSFNILDPLWQERNREELKSYDLIIFDNLQCLTNNRAKEIKLLMEFLNRIAQQDTAVLVLDQTSRIDKIQGSIPKGMSLDLAIKLEKTEQKKTIKVSYPAAKYMDDDSDFLLRMVFTEEAFNFELVTQEADSKPDVTGKIKNLAEVKRLRDVEGMSFNSIGKKLNISKSTAHRHFEKIGKLLAEKKGPLNQETGQLLNENSKDSKDRENLES